VGTFKKGNGESTGPTGVAWELAEKLSATVEGNIGPRLVWKWGPVLQSMAGKEC